MTQMIQIMYYEFLKIHATLIVRNKKKCVSFMSAGYCYEIIPTNPGTVNWFFIKYGIFK